MENSPEPLNLQYAATMEGLFAALHALEQACNNWKINADLVSRALIVVEELFSNTIKYGYGAEGMGPVRLGLSPLPRLTITYEDDARPFDPIGWKAPDEAVLPEEPREGGAGIALVVGLCASVVYQPRPGGNRLVITL